MKVLRVTFIFILFAALFGPHAVLAQYPSDNGLFEVDVVRGCPGTTIQITNLYTATCDCLAGCSCDFDYDGDGNFEVILPDPFEFTYADPGVYRLEILFSGTSDFITITIEDKPAPDFTVYSCAGQTVQVNIPDTNYESYEIDYGDGTIVNVNQGDPVPDHTYPDGAPRTISVRGLDTGSSNNCPVSTKDITPLSTLPAPGIDSITPIDPSSLLLGFTNQDDIFYELRMAVNGGSYSALTTITQATASLPVSGLDLENNYYCFRLVAVDPCGGPEAPSNEACSILLDLAPGNSSAALSWQTGSYTGDVNLYKNGSLLVNLPNGTTTYTDTNLVCGANYCYEVSVDFNGALSTSLPRCVDIDNELGPPPVNNISAIVNNQGNIDLEWYIDVLPSLYEGFEVYRQTGSSLPDIVADVTQVNFIDEEVKFTGDADFCYEIVPRDYCGNRTPANVVGCVINLQGYVDPTDAVTLAWNPYSGYFQGVEEYIVEKSYGGTLQEVARVQDTTFTETDSNPDSQVLMYRVTAVPVEDDLRISRSLTIILYKSNNLHYPDAFSPDGDGLNDNFEVKARFVSRYEIMIFNRWGEMIFHSTDITDSWNGILNGKNVQEGAYAVKLRLTDESGRETHRDASIIVVRR